MPVTPTYPGVYIEEIPSGVHTIVGVATSITAFLGRTKYGPVNLARTLTSFADFERTFGGLDPGYPLSYSVSDFFSNGGSLAVVVRLFSDAGATAAQAVAKAAADSNDPVPAKVAEAARTKAKEFKDDPGKTSADAVATAAEGAAAAGGATTQKVKDAAKAKADNITDTSSATVTVNDNLKLKAIGPGTWGNNLYIKLDTIGITDEVAGRYNLDTNLLFNLSIYNNQANLAVDQLNNRQPDERIQNISIWKEAGARRIDRVLDQVSNLLTFSGKLPEGKADATADKATTPTPPPGGGGGGAGAGGASPLTQLQGGLDSSPLTDPSIYLGDESKKNGMHALDDVDLFNIMCIPPDQRGGDTDKGIYDKALDYCVSRRAILIVDPPTDWANRPALLSTPAAKLTNDINLNGERARNAFLYYPRVRMSDPKRGGQIDTFPACGILAGVFARTDTQRGVWVAPAGLDASLGGVSLEVNLTDRENGILNPLGINCLRTFSVAGRVVWGARTLRGADQLADEYKYLPVRRTALFIEESLYRGTQWVVFQPNDEPLWAQIRLNVGAFMNDLFRKGAFQGSRAQDAYFVRCDRTTTTQNDIDRGVVNIVVGFAPLKPAEFVIIQVQQIAGQIQV
jgi:phage tail sheath protein FI